MTKREKIINYLIDNGIDVLRLPFIIDNKKWQRSGTLVIDYHFLRDDEKRKLNMIDYLDNGDGTFSHDSSCPIEVHYIRYHFEWQESYRRIIWKGEK